MLRQLATVALLGLLYGRSQALEVRGTEEGTCRTIQDIKTEDVDPTWLDTLPYITGGSKYHLYRQSRGHPRFRQMRESEFYYDACMVKNTSLIEGNGSLFGFGGRVLGSFNVRRSRDPKSLVDAIPSNPQTGQPSDYFRQKVTMTDYATYAVMVHCWVGADQRSWNVYSLLPELDSATERQIEDHLEWMGFKRENFIFLRRGNCQRELPWNHGGDHGSDNQHRLSIGHQKGQQRPRENQQRYESYHTGSGASSGSIKRGIPSGGISLKNTSPAVQRPVTLPATPKCLGRGCSNVGSTDSHQDRLGSSNSSPGLGWTSERTSL